MFVSDSFIGCIVLINIFFFIHGIENYIEYFPVYLNWVWNSSIVGTLMYAQT